jgi:SAM-dependent methyltransferase
MNLGIPDLQQASSHEEIVKLQIDAIASLSKQLGRPLSIVEAGCGQCWLIDLTGVDYTLTGIDLEPAALELRKTKTRDLDVGICGDLCSLDLPKASFDVIYSFYVLEHVERADIALQNFVKWLKPGGLLLLRLPDPSSVRGFFTRVLPHRAHVWYHRYIHGIKLAGQSGHAPYPVHYHPAINRERLCNFLAEHGLKCTGCYGDGFRRESQNRIVNAAVSGVSKLTALISLGRLHANYADVLYIAVKSAGE